MMSQWRTMFIYVMLFAWSWEVVAQPPQPVTNATSNVADLMLMVDCSYYISPSEFNTLLKSVASFVETLPLGSSAVHVAALSYSNVVDRRDFTSDTTLAQNGILDLFFDGQAAFTHAAFDVVYNVMASRRTLRPEARQILVVITESFARYPAYSRESAERLLEAGVEIWALGIGPYIRQLELLDYTRNLSRTILWDRFDVLPPIPLGFSSSITPTAVTNTTDAATATPRIQESTSSKFTITSENTLTSVSSSTASPTATSTQFMTSSSATTTASVAPTTVVAVSITPGSSTTTSLATTASSRISSASIYSYITSEVTATTNTPTTSTVSFTSIPGSPASIQVTSSTDVPAFSSLSVSSRQQLSASSVPLTSTMITSSYVHISDATGTSASANPTLTSLSMTPLLTPTVANPILTSPSMTPLLTPTVANPVLTTTLVTPHSSLTTLAPTPTQTDLIVSPTKAVEDPRNNTTIDETADDGSVVFNSSEKDGLCYKAVASKGFGFVPHPRDCDKFLQCHKSETGTVTATVRHCPVGQFWKQANLSCVRSDLACCKDPCETRCDGLTFKMDGGCGRYWECSRGVSMARKCPLFHAYISGKGCVFMSTCVDADRSTGSCHYSGKCDSLPVRQGSGYRIQTLGSSFDFTCWSSTKFDLASCLCRPLKTLSTCCHLVTLLNMTSHVVTDKSDINYAMVQAGCATTHISDNQTTASTTGGCSSDQSPSSDPMRDVTLHFRYLSSNMSSSLPQVLVRSRACVPERGGILVVSEDTSSLDVKVISTTGYVLTASLPLLVLNKSSWWEVHMQYTRGDIFLELTADNLIYNIHAKGGPHIPVGSCSWTVGEPEELSDQLSKFTGNISEVLVSRCNENGF